ncbi:MAG: hypothetical protein V4795_08050 [Pseudomonadota bacterium]
MIWWELVLFFGAPLLWGGWQLHVLRRDRRAAERQQRQDHADAEVDRG